MKRIIILIVALILFSSISYALVTDSVNGLKFNQKIFEDLGIYIYGDYEDIPYNAFKSMDNGYYSSNGILGEYRYHGFDKMFNPYTNEKFPNDMNSYIKLSAKNWIERGWNNKNYNDDIYYSYLDKYSDGIEVDYLKEAYENMLPFKLSIDKNVYDYLYISQFPSILYPGQGIMWHKTENGTWYQSFSLKTLEDKLPAEVKLELTDYDVDAFNLVDERQRTSIKLVGLLDDQNIYKDALKRSIYYNRDDIEKFIFSINGETFEVLQNESFNQSYLHHSFYLSSIDIEKGFIDINASVYVKYLNGKTSEVAKLVKRVEFDKSDNEYIQSYFNTGNIIKNGSIGLCDIAYFNLSKGIIDGYEITFINRGIEKTYILSSGDINESVKNYLLDFIEVNEIPIESEIEIIQKAIGEYGESTYSQFVEIVKADEGIIIDFTIPDDVFDKEIVYASNGTNMGAVSKKQIFINNNKVNFDYFFSGKYSYGFVDQDRLIPVDIVLTSYGGINYEYHTWVLIKSTKPIINFVQQSIARENHFVEFLNKDETVNSVEKLSKYPVEYEVVSNKGEIQHTDDGFDIKFNNKGIYDVKIIADNGVRKSSIEYSVVVQEDLSPYVYMNIYDNQIYRGDKLKIDFEYLSIDGDSILGKEIKVFEDLDNNGIYEKSYSYDANKTYDKLGSYKIVASVWESEKTTEIERTFIVDNKMPITTLSLKEDVLIEKVDLLIVMNGRNENIIENISEYENILGQKGFDARVFYFNEGTEIYKTNVVENITYGINYPHSTYNYSKDGFTGTLSLDAVQDLGEFVDEGEYRTRRTCKDVPVYEKIRSCSICGTYYNALGFKMCKFCYVVSGTVRKCTTKKYWVSDIVWVPNYIGIYSGEVSKEVATVYEDAFRPDSKKVIFYLDTKDNELSNWQYKSDFLFSTNENDILSKLNEVFSEPSQYPNTYLINESFDLLYGNYDFDGDSIIKKEFVFNHNPEYLDNSLGTETYSDVWRNVKLTSFSKPGLYEVRRRIFDDVSPSVYSKQSNEPMVFIKVHRKPVVNFDINQSEILELIDFSYDPDYEFSREDKGVVETKIVIEDNKGNKIYHLPDSLLPGEYTVVYSVKDLDGVWESLTKEITIKENVAYLTADVSPKVVSIKDRVYLNDVNLYGNSIYKVSIDVNNDNIHLKYYYVPSAGKNIGSFNYVVPSDTVDGKYYFRVDFVDYRNASKGMTYYYPFSVHSPIDLKLLDNGKVIKGGNITIKATTEDYVKDVFLFDGDKLKRMNLQSGVWQIQTKAKDGMYIKAVLNNKEEKISINFDYEKVVSADIKIIGDWNYWRGQRNIFDEKVKYNPDRFMSFENITITIDGLEEYDGEVVLDLDNRLDENNEYPMVLNKLGSEYIKELILPLVNSSLSYEDKRLNNSYYISVSYDNRTVMKRFDITGNVYDRIYIQPEF